ncbi:hypothetical protein T310_2539 [Rasamsonia emersonii CBS 393.64]|uniref:Cytochrome b561 domain-containing protein n=1 Tax=Rasamsonia emersonii (strain ATCC 16479 / CBS 393.64 / IMI 116815) TaxID=1408163 RepID=A0A0F4Z0S1_RASE3|nr:hypothetical protein T310_2539 [Rasamsonia emersonii CBS 393.64]KKA23473.1 hypothetical protein T310_2539 [Rasamsonia emersonii CBS 393.64]
MWPTCRRGSWLLLTLISAAFLWPAPAVAAGAQYCHDKLQFCMAVATKANATTHGRDVFVSLSARPSENGGWTAVGIGQVMAGALMLLVYSDSSKASVTASIRTASGHVMPTVLTANTTKVGVLHAEMTESKDYYAQFVCYSCDQWWPDKIDMTSTSQPWIYASNTKQIFYTAENDANLMIHDSYGVLTVDMSSTLIADGDPIPAIQPGALSFGVSLVKESSERDHDKQEAWPSAVQLHGIIMTISLMGLFGAGGAIIRLPLAQSFRYHWIVQLTASILAVGSALYMLLRAKHLGPHKIIGLIVISALIVQGALGYKHHAVFVKLRRQSLYTTLHRWLGRTVLCLGIFNVGTGLYYRGWSTLGLIAWLVVAAAEVAGYSYVVYLHQRRRRQEQGKPIQKDEDDEEIFDVGVDDDIEEVPLMERAEHEHEGSKHM